MDSLNKQNFQKLVHAHGQKLYRPMPWRDNTSPYYILVSELMLQQTQVGRVIPKFEAFIQALPTIEALAHAPLSQVLTLWSGLGYNRRAQYLHLSAKKIVNEYNSAFPSSRTQLETLPGVGKNTSGAIMVYAYNQPEVFIETNIRTVYFHHYFKQHSSVADSMIADILKQTLDMANPRQFYWALMDYGTYLKSQGYGMNAKSKHYKKQAPLEGSLRQMRGLIIKAYVRGETVAEITKKYGSDKRFASAYEALKAEGFLDDKSI